MVVKDGHIGTGTPEGETRVRMAAAVFAADRAWGGAEARVPPDVVPEQNLIRAVARVVLVLKPRPEGCLWPVGVEIVRGVADLAALDQPVFVTFEKQRRHQYSTRQHN